MRKIIVGIMLAVVSIYTESTCIEYFLLPNLLVDTLSEENQVYFAQSRFDFDGTTIGFPKLSLSIKLLENKAD
jgi:hypothetical protein